MGSRTRTSQKGKKKLTKLAKYSKKGMREMVDKEIAKRADVKRKYETRISQLLETIEAEKENFSGKQAEFSNYQKKLREQSLELEQTT